jgi:hypothetical protein
MVRGGLGFSEADFGATSELRRGDMPTLGESAYFSDNAYGTPGGALAHNLQKSWRRMQLPIDPMLVDNQFTGFRAHVYHNEATREVVIAFAGTEDSRDIKACYDIAMSRLPRQFWNARALYSAVGQSMLSQGIRAQISFTGHSLGGALAQYMAIAAQGCPTVNFGGPGVLGALGILKGEYDPGYSYPVMNHVAYGDEFANFGRHVGKVAYHSFEHSGNAQPGSLPLANDEAEIVRRLLVTMQNHEMKAYIKELKKRNLMSSFGKKRITHVNGVTYEVVTELNPAGRVRKKTLIPV